MPLVIQLNKRDLPAILGAEEMLAALNDKKSRHFEAVAIQNQGVVETFRAICAEVLARLRHELSPARTVSQ
jgi:signal recognition particle receptor subunit beta